MKTKPRPKPQRGKPTGPVRNPKIHQGWRLYCLYREYSSPEGWCQGITHEVLAKNQAEAQSEFGKYIGRKPPLQAVVDYSDVIGTWPHVAAMKPRVVRDLAEVRKQKVR